MFYITNFTCRHILKQSPKLILSQKFPTYFDRVSSFVPLCTCTTASQTSEEENIRDVLKVRFQEASTIKVQDVSGGCGAMFEVWVESHEFEGLSTVKQHRMITQTLKEQIKNMHGLRISTSVPQNGS